jgi:hypothetical protein
LAMPARHAGDLERGGPDERTRGLVEHESSPSREIADEWYVSTVAAVRVCSHR